MSFTPEQLADWLEHALLTDAFAQSVHDLGEPCTGLLTFSTLLETSSARIETRAFGTAIRCLAGAFAREWIWGKYYAYIGWLNDRFPDLLGFEPSFFQRASFEPPYGHTLQQIIIEMEQQVAQLSQRIEAYSQVSTSWITDDDREHLAALYQVTLQLQAALVRIRTILVDRVTRVCDS